MKILFVASEAVPFCKTGGLADVVGTLAQKLGAAGHDVCLFLPKYRCVRAPQLDEGSELRVEVPFEGSTTSAGLRLLHRRMVTTYFVDHPAFYDRDGLYSAEGQDHADNARRFAFFARAALEGAKAVGFKPDVVHAHDWQTGLVCAHLKRHYANDGNFSGAGSVFTVHNMAYQGNFPAESLAATGLGADEWTAEGLEYYGQVSYLKAGLAYADRITTVSPTYAREIQESGDKGFGFEGLLRRRSSVLRGVLNGLDTDAWDPTRDACLPRRYGPADALEGKAASKEALQKECALEPRADRPLIGVVSRLDYQKGLDLALPALEPLLDRAQFVILGTGDAILGEKFAAFERAHPGAVHFHRSFDEAFAHRVYAASDLFLMPSRSEPCGLGQMIAMRYGCVPVVASTGGLVDTVFERGSEEQPANGFLCAPNDPKSLSQALGRALDAYRGPRWPDLVKAAMSGDFSWDRSVDAYLRIYRQVARS